MTYTFAARISAPSGDSESIVIAVRADNPLQAEEKARRAMSGLYSVKIDYLAEGSE